MAAMADMEKIAEQDGSTEAILHNFIPNFLAFILVIPTQSSSTLPTRFGSNGLVRRTLKTANRLCEVHSVSKQVTLIQIYTGLFRLLTDTQKATFSYHIGKYVRNIHNSVQGTTGCVLYVCSIYVHFGEVWYMCS